MTFEIFSYWFTVVGISWLAIGFATFIIAFIVEELPDLSMDDLPVIPLLLGSCLALGPLGTIGFLLDKFTDL
jgi:hypothetical protein